MDNGLLGLLLKFGGGMLGLLAVVWVIALLTPKAAKIVDKIIGKKPPSGSTDTPERVEDNNNAENYKVYSIFEDRPSGSVNRPNGAVNGIENNKKEKDENG